MTEIEHIPNLERIIGLTEEQIQGLRNKIYATQSSHTHIGMPTNIVREVNRKIDLLNSEVYFQETKDMTAEEVQDIKGDLLVHILEYGCSPRTNELLVKQGFKKAEEHIAEDHHEVINKVCWQYGWTFGRSFQKRSDFINSVYELEAGDQLPVGLRNFHVICERKMNKSIIRTRDENDEIIDAKPIVLDTGRYHIIFYEKK